MWIGLQFLYFHSYVIRIVVVYFGDTGKMPSHASHLEWTTSKMKKLYCWLTNIKECGPYVVIFLNRTPMWWGWTTRSKYYRHHSKFNNEHHNWEGPCAHLKRKRIFTSTSNKFGQWQSLWIVAIASQVRRFSIRFKAQKCPWSWSHLTVSGFCAVSGSASFVSINWDQLSLKGLCEKLGFSKVC